MLFVVLSVVGVVVTSAVIVYGSRNKTIRHRDLEWRESVVALSLIASVFTIGLLCAASGLWIDGTSKVTRYEASIDATHAKEATYERRAVVVGETLRGYLIEQYPTYEQQTIDRVLAAGPELILLRFPELRAAETFVKYAEQYRSLQDAIYRQQTKRADLRAEIAAVRNNDLVYPFL